LRLHGAAMGCNCVTPDCPRPILISNTSIGCIKEQNRGAGAGGAPPREPRLRRRWAAAGPAGGPRLGGRGAPPGPPRGAPGAAAGPAVGRGWAGGARRVSQGCAGEGPRLRRRWASIAPAIGRGCAGGGQRTASPLIAIALF